jgi:hypothetical protein
MFGVIRPLGMTLATMPVGDGVSGTAGANFQLAYRSNFLLPHRRVAWLRFIERLDEAAGLALGIGGLDAVAGSLTRTMERLSAHVDV